MSLSRFTKIMHATKVNIKEVEGMAINHRRISSEDKVYGVVIKCPQIFKQYKNYFGEMEEIVKRGIKDNQDSCKHQYVCGWDLGECARCGKKVGEERKKKETELKEKIEKEDEHKARQLVEEQRRQTNKADKVTEEDIKRAHAQRLHSYGISVEALLMFTFAHNCWEKNTEDVVRDIIKPITKEHGRCRYAEILEKYQKEIKIKEKFIGPATVFMSHCWKSKFGDLVAAACEGATEDRFVWIDIFAVRQWPGSVADLDFRGVICRCNFLFVSISPVERLRVFMRSEKERQAFIEDEEGGKKCIPFFRLWCIVEVAAAVGEQIKTVVVAGETKKVNSDTYRHDKEGLHGMIANLVTMIDVEKSECFRPEDYKREMKFIKERGGGIKRVNDAARAVVVESICDSMIVLDDGMRRKLDLIMDALQRSDDDDLDRYLEPLLKRAAIEGNVELFQKIASMFKNESKLQKLGALVNKFYILELASLGTPVFTTENRGIAKNSLTNESTMGWGDSADPSNDRQFYVVKFLLENIPVNVNVYNISSPLHLACKRGDIELVSLLLEQEDIDINAPDRWGKHPLYYVTIKNTYEVPDDIIFQIKHLLYQHKDTPTRCRLNWYAFYRYLFVIDLLFLIVMLWVPDSTTRILIVNWLYYILYFAITILSCYYTYYGFKDGKDVELWKKLMIFPKTCGCCIFVGWLLFCGIGTAFKPIPFDAICPAPQLYSLNETTSNVSKLQ